jgi:hypothetical protein
MLTITPNNVTSFPGARITFTLHQDGQQLQLSTLDGARVEIYFPGQGQALGTIHETDNTFSWIVPMEEGTHKVRIVAVWEDESDHGEFTVKVNPVLAATFTYQADPNINPTGTLHADVYNPVGQLVYSTPMTFSGLNYEFSKRPENEWYEGEYRIALRDETGVLDVDSAWIERPNLASMKMFFDLPLWQRQLIEYLKYEMMGDTDPMHPGALFTLEEYAKHWRAVVEEINHVPPYTNFHPAAIDLHWANVLLKGTLLRVYHALSNRAVTIPRFTNLDAPIQDESHYQQAWESRYNTLRPEYIEERAYMKGYYLPQPAITVDPFLGWVGGNLAGTSGLALIGRPNWFSSSWGYR